MHISLLKSMQNIHCKYHHFPEKKTEIDINGFIKIVYQIRSNENPFHLYPFLSHSRAEYFNIDYFYQWWNGKVFKRLENILMGGGFAKGYKYGDYIEENKMRQWCFDFAIILKRNVLKIEFACRVSAWSYISFYEKYVYFPYPTPSLPSHSRGLLTYLFFFFFF